MTGGQPPYSEFRREAAPLLDRAVHELMTMPRSEICSRFAGGWSTIQKGERGRTVRIDGDLVPLGDGNVRLLLTAAVRLDVAWSDPVGGRFVEIRGNEREAGSVFVERWIDSEVARDMSDIAADMRRHRRRRAGRDDS